MLLIGYNQTDLLENYERLPRALPNRLADRCMNWLQKLMNMLLGWSVVLDQHFLKSLTLSLSSSTVEP